MGEFSSPVNRATRSRSVNNTNYRDIVREPTRVAADGLMNRNEPGSLSTRNRGRRVVNSAHSGQASAVADEVPLDFAGDAAGDKNDNYRKGGQHCAPVAALS